MSRVYYATSWLLASAWVKGYCIDLIIHVDYLCTLINEEWVNESPEDGPEPEGDEWSCTHLR